MKRIALTITAVAVVVVAVAGIAGPASAEGYRAFTIDKTVPITQAGGALGVDTSTNLVYAANPNFDTVTVIDGSTDAPHGAPIAVGQMPMAVAVNPTTHRIYVPNRQSHTISVIDGPSQAVIDTIDVGSTSIFGQEIFPTAVAVNEMTNTIYVVNRGVMSDVSPGELINPPTVIVIDGQSDTVTTAISLPVLDGMPYGISVDPTTNQVYVADYPGLQVIDGRTNTLSGSISTVSSGSLEADVRDLVMNPKTQTLYAAGYAPGTVYAINTSSNTIVASINVGALPTEMGVNVATNTIYVPSGDDDSVSVIDGATNTLTGAPINVGHKPSAALINSVTRKLYVTNFGDQSLTVAHEWISPTIATKSIPSGNLGVTYVADITATGFSAPTFSVTAGTFPPGLIFNPTNGHISGAPAKIGVFTFVVTAHNKAGNDVSATYTVKVS